MDNARKMSGETYPSKIMVFTPKKNMAMKITIFDRRCIFKWSIFHCHVSFGGVYIDGKNLLYFREIEVGKYIRMLRSSIQNRGYLDNVPEYTTQL